MVDEGRVVRNTVFSVATRRDEPGAHGGRQRKRVVARGERIGRFQPAGPARPDCLIWISESAVLGH